MKTMTVTRLAAAGAAASAIAAGSVFGAGVASAEGAATQPLGSQGKLVDGNVVQGWTVTALKPSTDTIAYPVAGALWEATATDAAIQGGATPIVSNFNARAKSGQTYRTLFEVPTSQGVNPATLVQGEETSGKVYFDVTGEQPDSVVYNAGGQDLLIWLPAAPQPSSSGTGQSPASRGGSATAPAATPGAAEATPTEPTEGTPGATAPEGTPADTEGAPLPASTDRTPGEALPEGSQGTPLPEGSQGTPLPTGSQGTPLPADNQGTPPGENPGSPLPSAVNELPTG